MVTSPHFDTRLTLTPALGNHQFQRAGEITVVPTMSLLLSTPFSKPSPYNDWQVYSRSAKPSASALSVGYNAATYATATTCLNPYSRQYLDCDYVPTLSGAYERC